MPEAHDPTLIQHLAAQNILSFGPGGISVELRSLNVLIGPNGSGKSNLLELISLLRAAPKDWSEVLRRGGGTAAWIWQGGKDGAASLEAKFTRPQGPPPIMHRVAFSAVNDRFELLDESILSADGLDSEGSFYISTTEQGSIFTGRGQKVTRVEEIPYRTGLSILAQLRDPRNQPEITWLAQQYEAVRLYRSWSFGPRSAVRDYQPSDARRDYLEEDYTNLGLFLSRIRSEHPAAKRAIIERLKDLYDGITDFEVSITGSAVQVFLHEGDFSIPATRLSDGTLRYLCLLAILCDPQPPPLICIEEPELGLHPDVLPSLARLLKSASERTQIIVTTHSDILVDAMTDTPEAIVVCEKHEGQTRLQRLSAEGLAVWLDKYRLGQLWIDGHLGGKRW